MSDFPAIAAYGASVGLDPESALTGWSPMPDSDRDRWRAIAAAARTVPDDPSPTGMRLHAGEAWTVRPDMRPGTDDDHHPDLKFFVKFERDAHTDQQVPVATLRRVGWLDQKGRVWTEIPPQAGFDGGSLTPLLIDARD